MPAGFHAAHDRDCSLSTPNTPRARGDAAQSTVDEHRMDARMVPLWRLFPSTASPLLPANQTPAQQIVWTATHRFRTPATAVMPLEWPSRAVQASEEEGGGCIGGSKYMASARENPPLLRQIGGCLGQSWALIFSTQGTKIKPQSYHVRYLTLQCVLHSRLALRAAV